MCNLYSIIHPRDGMARAFRVLIDRTGNQPPLPAVFPDQLAPTVRINSASGMASVGATAIVSPALSTACATQGKLAP